MSYSNAIADINELDSDGIVMILDKLSLLIGDCEELDFSVGKWSKSWLKIKFRRQKHGIN